jgi:soluble epoxide hydrolase / lipid-phosphate phosphatase
MLGYGGTDKPTDPNLYRYDAIGKDLVDILDTEKLSKVIAVGHDWCVVIDYYPGL